MSTSRSCNKDTFVLDPRKKNRLFWMSTAGTPIRIESTSLERYAPSVSLPLAGERRENRSMMAMLEDIAALTGGMVIAEERGMKLENVDISRLGRAKRIKIDNENTIDPTVLVKLYEPLPPEFDLKSELWVVTTLNEPEAFRVTFPNQVIDFDDTIQLQKSVKKVQQYLSKTNKK